MTMRRFAALVLALVLMTLSTSDALAGKKTETEGVPIKVTVLDEKGQPITTAVVRHPDEADRHRVNSMTGALEISVLYLPDGSELIFTPGTTVKFQSSAPGYMTQIIQYDIRKRKNNLEVTLPALALEESDIDEPVIQFGRDKPRDEGSTGPAN